MRQTGGCGGIEGQGKRGDMGGGGGGGGGGGVVNKESIGHDSILILKMYMPCRSCLLNSLFIPICITPILPNPDRNLGSTSVQIKPVHLYLLFSSRDVVVYFYI